jgi:hypothetical protein
MVNNFWQTSITNKQASLDKEENNNNFTLENKGVL